MCDVELDTILYELIFNILQKWYLLTNENIHDLMSNRKCGCATVLSFMLAHRPKYKNEIQQAVAYYFLSKEE